MRIVILLVSAASLFWLLMFFPATTARVPFWPAMVLATAILAGAFFAVERGVWRARFAFEARHLWQGLAAAAALYLIFWAGNELSRQILPFAGGEISAIHARKAESNLWWVGTALLLWIGPAEEIFWRGLIQHRLMRRLGPVGGTLLAALIYAGVHAWSLNVMLVLAALVCGLFWGLLYLWTRSLWPGIISHAVWDLVIFVLLPIGS
jgi:uncharacterized protein